MSARRLYLDAGPGESRGVVTLDGRPERLLIARATDQGLGTGTQRVGRVRRMERAMASAFIDLGEGPDGVLTLSGEAARLSEGLFAAFEVTGPARLGKGPVVRLIGPEAGPVRMLLAAPSLESQLMTFAPGQGVNTTGLARELADLAQAEVLEIEHALPGSGTIAIQPTRALTAIDVDLGAHTGGDPRRAMRQANLAALAQGARLLRLKGLGGLVVFDLIGRGLDGAAMTAAARLAFDPDQPGVVLGPVSRFGTLELALPRRQAPLGEILCDSDGALSVQTLALTLMRMAEDAGRADPGGRLQLVCHTAVAEQAKALSHHLAARLGQRYEIEGRAELARNHLDVRPL
jgi:Ribonuclease G/E